MNTSDAVDLVNKGGVLVILVGAIMGYLRGWWRSEKSHREVVDRVEAELIRERERADKHEQLAWRLATTTERAADIATSAVTGKGSS